MSVPHDEPLEYNVQINPKNQFYEIGRETLTQKNKGCAQPFTHLDSHGMNIQYFDRENSQCPEMKSFINTLLTLSDAPPLI